MRQPQGLPLRLLIIDSIAHLFRDIGDHTDASAYVRRTGMLFRLSALLRRFADTYNLAVVVTNQVLHSSFGPCHVSCRLHSAAVDAAAALHHTSSHLRLQANYTKCECCFASWCLY